MTNKPALNTDNTSSATTARSSHALPLLAAAASVLAIAAGCGARSTNDGQVAETDPGAADDAAGDVVDTAEQAATGWERVGMFRSIHKCRAEAIKRKTKTYTCVCEKIPGPTARSMMMCGRPGTAIDEGSDDDGFSNMSW